MLSRPGRMLIEIRVVAGYGKGEREMRKPDMKGNWLFSQQQ